MDLPPTRCFTTYSETGNRIFNALSCVLAQLLNISVQASQYSYSLVHERLDLWRVSPIFFRPKEQKLEFLRVVDTRIRTVPLF